MGKVKVLENFTGPVSGFRGQELEISDQNTIDSLVKAGYVEAIQEPKPTTRKSKKATDLNENE